MRSQYDSNSQFRTSSQIQLTPRAANRPNIPIDTSRRSTTPSRIQERVSNSPLKVPLSNAINKASRNVVNQNDRTGQSRYLGKSNRRGDESPIISMAKKIYYQEDPQTQELKSHPETYNFIKKHFETINLEVPLDRLVQKIMQEYETLWGTQNADKISDDFTYKVAEIFGTEYVDLRELVRVTREDGMIGLILRIFKEIKNEENTRSSNYMSFSQNPQVVNISRSFQQKINQNESIVGIKNVVQQFMESMYQAMQAEIYEKFNVEMRRMIIKYREAEKVLKKVNEKINNYADVFDFDSKLKEKEKRYESLLNQITSQKDRALFQLQKQRNICALQKKQKLKFEEQNSKLKQTLEKYQNALLAKAMQNNNNEIGLFRQNSGLSRVNLNQRQICEPLGVSQISNNNMNMNNMQPFKITIDTHVVHKQNMPPEVMNVATIHPLQQQPPPQRDSYQRHPIYSTSPFTTSRVTTVRPLSPTPLSPCHSRIHSRPI